MDRFQKKLSGRKSVCRTGKNIYNCLVNVKIDELMDVNSIRQPVNSSKKPDAYPFGLDTRLFTLKLHLYRISEPRTYAYILPHHANACKFLIGTLMMRSGFSNPKTAVPLIPDVCILIGSVAAPRLGFRRNSG